MDKVVQPTDIQQRMAEIRCELGQDVEGIVENARSLIDWRHCVHAYPWWCVGLAVAAGYLVVPKRREVIRLEPTAVAEMLKHRPMLVEPRGVLQGMSAALASSIANVALRWGADRLAHWSRELRASPTAECGLTPAPAGAPNDPSQ
jgi:hypothetical protein